MVNLKLIETAPRWRVAVTALVARALGITIKIEGIPFGSRRVMKPFVGESSAALAQNCARLG